MVCFSDPLTRVTRHTFMLSGCRLLLTTRMSAFTVAASAASVAARVGYATAPVARTKLAGRFDAHSRHIAVTPVCMGRKAAKVAAKKVRRGVRVPRLSASSARVSPPLPRVV